MICAIFMIFYTSLSVTFVMYFNGRNKGIYLFIYSFIFTCEKNLCSQSEWRSAVFSSHVEV